MSDAILGRVIPGVAIVLATAALVVVLAGGNPAVSSDPAETEKRLLNIEEKLDELCAKLDSAMTQPARPGEATEAAAVQSKAQVETTEGMRSSDPLPDETPWPVVARRLTADLSLTGTQIDALDRSLEECTRSLEALGKEDDKKRAEALGRLARRRAYRSVERALKGEQKKLFARLVRDPKCPGLRQWFMHNRPCGGCGKKKKAKPSEKAGSSS